MIFEYIQDGTLNFLEAYAVKTGAVMRNNRIDLPGSMGKGSIIRVNLGEGLQMAVFYLTPQQDLVFSGKASGTTQNALTIGFRLSTPGNHHFPDKMQLDDYAQPDTLIQLSSDEMAAEMRFTAGATVLAIQIIVQRDLLKHLLGNSGHALVEHIICHQGPHLYNEAMTQEIQCVMALIHKTDNNGPLGNYYYSIKAHELLYLLFYNLAKRTDTPCISIRKDDLCKIHDVKDHMLSDLSIIPELNSLAIMAGMSESKLKRIFKQVFGTSIYHYYQTARMNEAAYLIRKYNLSIAEVGYQLGFSNLSHFSRLFHKHIGIKPKKYALANNERG